MYLELWTNCVHQYHKYQTEASNFLLDRLRYESGAGLWLDPGLGKTVVTLRTIDALKLFGDVKRTIIVAPSRVIATSWPKEIKNWGFDLTWQWLEGDEKSLQDAVDAKADIYFISCENLALRTLVSDRAKKRSYKQLAEWLLDNKFSSDLLVVDESTKFKNFTSARTKTLKRMLRRIPKRITLTGTPMENGIHEIFAQQYILDGGRTLSPFIGHFRDHFMQRCGFENREWEMRKEMVPVLMDLLAPWYIRQSALEHLDLPEVVHNVIDVELPERAKAVYKRMEKEMYAELEAGVDITATSGGGKYNLCRQIASGNAYSDDGKPIGVHSAKLDALETLVDGLNGKPLLVAYWYDHEATKILERFPLARAIRGGTSKKDLMSIMSDWQTGKCNMIVAQASAISHGVDGLQKTCNDLCWYTLTDQPGIFQQLQARIHRQGVQGNQVRFHYLQSQGTLDVAIYKALKNKAATQAELLSSIKSRN